MANQSQLFSQLPLPPLTVKDIAYDPFPLEIPADILQLQADTLNVFEGRVSIESFPPDYQEKMKNYYRFAAHFQTSKSHNVVQRIAETLEII